MTDSREQQAESKARRRQVDLVVITGYSGAGKSEAIAAFEDGGYFCVDNIPPRMIGALGELFQLDGSGVRRAAIVSDVRGGDYFQELVAVLDEIDAAVIRWRPMDGSSRGSGPSATCWLPCASARTS